MSFDSLKENLEVFSFEIECKELDSFIKNFRSDLLTLKNLPFISKEVVNGRKKVYLHQQYHVEGDIPENLREIIKEQNQSLSKCNIEIGFAQLSANEVLRKLLPENIVIPTSFETVGTLIHMNLRPEHEAFKNLIGKVILAKNPSIKTVVNKKEKLGNVFRTPILEVIAGEGNFETNVNEGNCIFKLDYSKVYWNSRLQNERDRVLTFLNSDDVLCDLFCGVGPLSIRAAKKGIKCYANDLNPDCFHYLKENALKNQVSKNILTFNLDARFFFKKLTSKKENLEFGKFTKVYMNLPGDAINFVDIFNGFMIPNKDLWETNPLVMLYTFIQNQDTSNLKQLTISKLKKLMPAFEEENLKDIYEIRDISSKKKMYCLTFEISKEVGLFECEDPNTGENPKKMVKIN